MKKVAFRILIGLLVVTIVAGVVIYFNLNRILKRSVETHATDSLSLQTELGAARLAIFGGRVSLDDLTIASPQGFATPHMLSLDRGAVQVKYGQLGRDPVRISSITLRQPTIVVEQANGKFNFQTLMDLVPKRNPTDGSPKDGDRQDGEPIRMIVDRLTVQDARVLIKPGTIPGLSTQLQDITIPIPSFEMKNIGNADGAENGAAIKDVAAALINELVAKAKDSGNLDAQLKNALEGGLKDMEAKLRNEVNQRLQTVQTQIQDRLKDTPLKDAPIKLDDRVQDLLGGKDKDANKGSEKPKKRKQ